MTEADQSLLESASKAYYEGSPIMSDEQFDALERNVIAESDLEEPALAGGYVPESRKVDHVKPMLSLAKVHSHDDLLDWLRKTAGDEQMDLTVEPKWDGLAIEVVVQSGKITMASTRGDGMIGENVTDTVSLIPDVIASVDQLIVSDSVQVLNFEIVLDRSVLAEINAEFELDFKNTRNAVAGIIRREDYLGPKLAPRLRAIDHSGTQRWTNYANSYQEREITQMVQAIEDARPEYPCDIDGVVVKITDQAVRNQLGATSHSPRWAVAYKFPAQSSSTTLRSVSWRRGRTGRITPVATFDPILLAGATISNATLHNVEFVNNLDLRIGDVIMVKRSGDVIPYIEGVVTSNPDGELVVPPSDIHDDDVIVDQIHHALVTLGADGIGYSTVATLMEAEVLTATSVVDGLDKLLSMKPGDISGLPGFGDRAEAKFLYAIESTELCYTRSWIAALGVPSVGRTVSETLQNHYGTLDAVLEAEYDNLIQLPGFGPSRAEAVMGALPQIHALTEVLNRHQIIPPSETVDEPVSDSEWSGLNVVITGSFEGYNRNDISAALASQGAVIQSGVTGKTDVLVAGAKAGSKLAKAESLGKKIVMAEELDMTSLGL